MNNLSFAQVKTGRSTLAGLFEDSGATTHAFCTRAVCSCADICNRVNGLTLAVLACCLGWLLVASGCYCLLAVKLECHSVLLDFKQSAWTWPVVGPGNRT